MHTLTIPQPHLDPMDPRVGVDCGGGAKTALPGSSQHTTKPGKNNTLMPPCQHKRAMLDVKDLTDGTISTHAVQRFLTEVSEDFESEEWVGKIVLPLVPIPKKGQFNVAISREPQMIDICPYLDGSDTTIGALYFSPRSYKPPKDGSKRAIQASDE